MGNIRPRMSLRKGTTPKAMNERNSLLKLLSKITTALKFKYHLDIVNVCLELAQVNTCRMSLDLACCDVRFDCTY